MEKNYQKKILVITSSIEAQGLYSILLRKTNSYLKYIIDIQEDLLDRSLSDVLDFAPHLIICDFSGYPNHSAICEFLLQVRENFQEPKTPLILAIFTPGSFPQEYMFLLDAFLPTPINPKLFFKTLDNIWLK